MDTGADIDTESLHAGTDGACTVDGASWSLEAHEEAVACCIDLGPLASDDFSSNGRSVLVEKLSPLRITEASGVFRRTDDVDEEKRREHPFRLDRPPPPAAAFDERTGAAVGRDEYSIRVKDAHLDEAQLAVPDDHPRVGAERAAVHGNLAVEANDLVEAGEGIAGPQ